MYVYVCVCTYVCTCVCMYTYTYIHTYIHRDRHTNTHTHSQTYRHTKVYTRTHNTHTHTPTTYLLQQFRPQQCWPKLPKSTVVHPLVCPAWTVRMCVCIYVMHVCLHVCVHLCMHVCMMCMLLTSNVNKTRAITPEHAWSMHLLVDATPIYAHKRARATGSLLIHKACTLHTIYSQRGGQLCW